uniref:Uncharacterized protein n=1 Tax=Arundo donax TaxID=35708 RepID=A0A0A9H1K2_ARUDO
MFFCICRIGYLLIEEAVQASQFKACILYYPFLFDFLWLFLPMRGVVLFTSIQIFIYISQAVLSF